MAEINQEIGLDDVLKVIGIGTTSRDEQPQVASDVIDLAGKRE